jgi:hypothetical protein
MKSLDLDKIDSLLGGSVASESARWSTSALHG